MKPFGKLAMLLVAMACALPAIAQSDETAKRFHVFPVLVDGGGWQSVLILTNVAQSASFCRLDLHGALAVDRFQDAEGVTASGSTATFDLSGAGGYLVWRTKNASPLASGYATLDCSAPVVAQVLYASRDGSGTTTGMATVFSSQAGEGFQFPVLTPEATLGIAIANHTNTDASCRVVLEGPERQNLDQAPLPVPSKSNVVRFLYETIQIPDGFTEGSATVSCDQRVSVIGLQFDGDIFTTLPPAILDLPPQPSDETAKRFHVFPVLVDGGGWQSVLIVTNASQSTSLCTLDLHGLSLDRFPVISGITVSGSTATFTIPGPGGYRVWPTRNELALALGYATLDCTDPVVAQVLYASRDQLGVTGMATVFSSQPGGVFQFPVLTADASLGIAIANDTNTEASCRVALESREHQHLGEATLPVASKSNAARFLSQIIQMPPGFAGGSATVSCDQQVSVIGLQFSGAIFLTLPPAVLSTTPVSLTTPAGLAPADQAAFDTLVVGKQIVQDAYNYRLIFIAAGRIREIDGGTPFTGNYRYARTGPNTGMLTYTYDDTGNAPNVERSEVLFTFTSATAGTFVYTHIEGGMILGPLPGSFELVDAESEGESFGVGAVLPGVPTGAQLFPVSGWATEWSGVIFSGTAGNATTYLTFDDGGYITLQTGTRYTCRAAGGCRVGNGVVSRGTIVGSTAFPPPPDPPPPPMSSTCAAGLVVQIDGSCDVVVGGSTVGTFSVSSTSGCLRIGGGITFCSGVGHNIQGSRFNQYLVTFVANRRQDGSWEITRYSISS